MRYEIDSAAPPQQFKFSPAKVAPRDLEWLTLEVQVRTGRVNKILVNGKLVGPPKDDPAEAMMARMSAQESLPCTGPFGIYCYGSGDGFSGMCRNMKIRPLTSNVVSNQHKENAHGDH